MRQGEGGRAENAAAVTGSKTRARPLLSAGRPPVLRNERFPRRGKSESRGGWAEYRISLVQSTGEWGAKLWTLTRDFPPRAGIRAEAT